ncbi:MAG: peptidoglycan DD-metalloendopeptidase family protein [Anaerolineae bacterium]|nr:peptidoglycan DD-metalloendopeptidase family protein [Anaerolineae bacterium]
MLRPPFNGTYRLNTYFDHYEPTFTSDPDGDVTLYTGETTGNCDPYCYRGHNGIDWGMDTGTDVLAAAAGVVVEARYVAADGFGCRVVLEHDNGYETTYAHLDGWWNGSTWVCSGIAVSVTDPVQKGTVLGDSGNTGISSGPHLHFTVEHNGFPTDPFGWRGSGQDPLVGYSGEAASCLWSGAPGDVISCGDVIIEDDGAAGWEQYPSWDKNCWESGSWQRCDKGNGYRYHWTDVWVPADFWVAWRPWYSTYGQLRYPGYYQVHAFVPAAGDSSKTKTGNARYEVHHGRYYNETTIAPVNQTAYSDQWAPLGTYWLWPGQMGSWVSLYDYTGEGSGTKKIVADSMRFSASVVHLPDVRNSGGWTSSIVVRNNGASAAGFNVNYYNAGGGLVSIQDGTIASNGSATKTPPSGFSGSAVVVASEDVSVVAVNDSSSRAYAYEGLPAAPSVSGIGVGTEVYVPAHFRNYYGWSSTLVVQNSGSAATTVHAYLYNDSGAQVDHQTANVNANGQAVFSSLSGTTIGSVRVTASQPLAVVMRHTNAGMDDIAYVGAVGSGGTGYIPSLFKNYYGWMSSYQLQETTGNRAWGNVIYYPGGSGPAFDLGSRGHREVWMGAEGLWNGWRGSIRASVSGWRWAVGHRGASHCFVWGAGVQRIPGRSAGLAVALVEEERRRLGCEPNRAERGHSQCASDGAFLQHRRR